MIIDAHCHVSDETWSPPWFWDGLSTIVAPRFGLSRERMDMVGPRVVFASDWAGLPDHTPYLAWVKAFTEIPPWVKEAEIEFTKEEMEGYLSGNALGLLLQDKKT